MANYGTRYQKKETSYGVLFLLLLILLVVAYCFSGIYNLSDLSMSFQEKIRYVFLHPLTDYSEKTPAFLILALLIWILVICYISYYYRDFHMDMEKGDARWLDVEEANLELADKDEAYNRIVSENLKISMRGALSNNNALVIGGSGSGKTTALMHQNLLQFNSTYVVLDVKGDTQMKLGKAFKEHGYQIKSLNFKQLDKSDRYNPFEYIEREDDVLRVIKALHDAVRPKNSMSAADPFWDDAVDLYLKALFQYAWLTAREVGKKATMNDVLDLCNMETQLVTIAEEEISRLQLLMEEMEGKYGAEYPPVRDYFKLKEGAPDTVRSVILMINGMLSICETAEVRRIFSGNDINIRDLGAGVNGDVTKKTVLFLCIPDQNPVYNWIVSMFYTQLFDILIRLSDDELKKPLPIAVEVWMDEIYAGAKPADLDKLIGVVRSRNISLIALFQSIAQIKATYKDDKWDVIQDNTATVVYLGSGPTAYSTHKYISDLLSETTADSRSDNVHVGSHGNSGLNFQKVGVKLMTPDQVKRMPQTECIVFVESHPPIYDRKAFPFARKKLDFEPKEWLKKRYDAALSLGSYVHPVQTVYDPVHFRYITVEDEQHLQFIEDPKEQQTYLEAAKNDPNILLYTIDERDVLYLNWEQQERSKEEVEALYKQALENEKVQLEKLKGLSVLQGMNSFVPNFGTNKSAWESGLSLKELLNRYWEALTLEEQEEICIALDDGLTEEQVSSMLYMSLDEMVAAHRAYMLANAAE